MDIKGLDYNTQRKPLLMPEYGREIQNMVLHAMTLATKAERTTCAKAIVKMMDTKITQQQDNAEHEQMLWDHLYLMSGKALDIDWPYDVSQAEKFQSKPQPIAIPRRDEGMGQRHYGRLLEDMFVKLKTMPEGRKRDELAKVTANQMRRVLTTWGHGAGNEERVADDLARHTDGRIQLDLNTFKFDRPATDNGGDNGYKRRKRR